MDALATASADFAQGFAQDHRVESVGVFVNAPVRQGDGGRLAVSNHHDLFHVFVLPLEDFLGQTQTLGGVGVVRPDLRLGELRQRDFLSSVVE